VTFADAFFYSVLTICLSCLTPLLLIGLCSVAVMFWIETKGK